MQRPGGGQRLACWSGMAGLAGVAFSAGTAGLPPQPAAVRPCHSTAPTQRPPAHQEAAARRPAARTPFPNLPLKTCPAPSPHRAHLLIRKRRHIVLQHAQLVHVVLPHNVGPVGKHLGARGEGRRGFRLVQRPASAAHASSGRWASRCGWARVRGEGECVQGLAAAAAAQRQPAMVGSLMLQLAAARRHLHECPRHERRQGRMQGCTPASTTQPKRWRPPGRP